MRSGACGALASRLSRLAFLAAGSRAAGWAGARLAGYLDLNPRLDGGIPRALHIKLLPRSLTGRARQLVVRLKHSPRRIGHAGDPSPCPPCRCYFFCWGRVCVPRPIEGLGSLRATRTLRIRRTRAGTRPLRVRDAVRWHKLASQSSAGTLLLSSPSMGRDTLLSPIQKSLQRQGGRGLGSQARTAGAGMSAGHEAEVRRGPLACAVSVARNRQQSPQGSGPARRRAEPPSALPLATMPPTRRPRQRTANSAAGKRRQDKLKARQPSPSPDTSPPTPSPCPACSATDTPGGR